MNVLLAAGPESTTLFTLTVRAAGRPAARLAGKRRITVPLNRLQSTHRRLLLAGDTILSVTRCPPLGDPPIPPHSSPAASPDGLPGEEAHPTPASRPEPAQPHPVEHAPEPARQDQTEDGTSVAENGLVLLFSLLGLLILLTIQVVQSLAQPWGVNAPARNRSPDPTAVGLRKRELANC